MTDNPQERPEQYTELLRLEFIEAVWVQGLGAQPSMSEAAALKEALRGRGPAAAGPATGGTTSGREDEPEDSSGERPAAELFRENEIFAAVLGQEILLTMKAARLNIMGHVFPPIFCGTVSNVTDGYLTLSPAVIKMNSAPFFHFQTPLSFPLDKIANFVPFHSSDHVSIP